MPVELAPFVNDLVPANPLGSDPAGQGDDHIRLIKSALLATLPNMGAVLGQVRRQDTAVSISSTWNTNRILVSASATATVVLTLPPAGSITVGFYIDITTIGTGTVSLLPSGAASINGGVSLSIPPLNNAHVYFVGGTSWLANLTPSGQGGNSTFGGNVSISGAVHIGGATSIGGALYVGGTLSISAAAVLGSSLAVGGASSLNGSLSVSGVATFNGTVSISGQATMLGGLTVLGAATISGTVVLGNGQLKFPVSQNPSADPNMLDDYEEGTFTPTLSFVTPGNLAVGYSERVGVYTKIGRCVSFSIAIVTSSFFHTTASGAGQITGLPFAPVASSGYGLPNFSFEGITKAGYTQVNGQQGAASTVLTLVASGSGQPRANVTTADMPSAGSVLLLSNHTIHTA